mmetsp:Transcript_23824/g.34938  ORF Transcript_23824/g.34938 Transcript_23824/m.34938 type:complete len:309 (-) Transcript_23824:213-1139(-)
MNSLYRNGSGVNDSNQTAVDTGSRRKTFDLPKVDIRKSSIQAFRSARETRSRLSLANDPWEETRSRPTSRYGSATLGYTGYRPKETDTYEEKRITTPKYIVRGYTGHIPGSIDVCGSPVGLGIELFSPIKDKQKSIYVGNENLPTCKYRSKSTNGDSDGKKLHAGHMKFLNSTKGNNASLESRTERYAEAVAQLHARGQKQEGLLRVIQSKLSERVTSYAQQIIRLQKIFDYFDFNDSKFLDEFEFRQFLDRSNCHLDDCQALALFAYFDDDNTGVISWEAFKKNCVVPNPKGGTAVLPKAITRHYVS